MILPLPTFPQSMGRESVVSTEATPNILNDMAWSIQKAHASESFLTRGTLGDSPSVQVFDHGIYTVVLASQADAGVIESVLQTVPARW